MYRSHILRPSDVAALTNGPPTRLAPHPGGNGPEVKEWYTDNKGASLQLQARVCMVYVCRVCMSCPNSRCASSQGTKLCLCDDSESFQPMINYIHDVLHDGDITDDEAAHAIDHSFTIM